MIMISKEAENLLFEIIEHESDGNHWAERFEAADHREDIILRGCFKELKDNNLFTLLGLTISPLSFRC